MNFAWKAITTLNFNGGDLSSDSGLFLLEEFAKKIGFQKVLSSTFKTNDTATFRLHTDTDNLMQEIYQTIAAHFRDDHADELISGSVFNALLDKDALASQPTLSRFFNQLDADTLLQFESIHEAMREKSILSKHQK